MTFKCLEFPMGLHTAPNSFQLLLDNVLHGLTFTSVLCYLDTICIISDTSDKHLHDLCDILCRLKHAGLKLGPRKYKFTQSKCVFLGHEISKDGIKPLSDKILKAWDQGYAVNTEDTTEYCRTYTSASLYQQQYNVVWHGVYEHLNMNHDSRSQSI